MCVYHIPTFVPMPPYSWQESRLHIQLAEFYPNTIPHTTLLWQERIWSLRDVHLASIMTSRLTLNLKTGSLMIMRSLVHLIFMHKAYHVHILLKVSRVQDRQSMLLRRSLPGKSLIQRMAEVLIIPSVSCSFFFQRDGFSFPAWLTWAYFNSASVLGGQGRQLFPKTSNPSEVLIVWKSPLAIMTNVCTTLYSEAISVGFNCMQEADQRCWLDCIKSGAFSLKISYWPRSSNSNGEIETIYETK